MENRKTRLGLFLAAVAAQVGIVALTPAGKFHTRMTGRMVILKVEPTDSYNALRGYSLALQYEIGKVVPVVPEPEIWAIVERGTGGVWHRVSIENARPRDLPGNRVAIRGRHEEGRFLYGIEEFHVPEARRGEIERDLEEHPGEARARVRVDAAGNAAIVALLVGDRVYE
jgi:uncharacterized membrane-anchored protein